LQCSHIYEMGDYCSANSRMCLLFLHPCVQLVQRLLPLHHGPGILTGKDMKGCFILLTALGARVMGPLLSSQHPLANCHHSRNLLGNPLVPISGRVSHSMCSCRPVHVLTRSMSHWKTMACHPLLLNVSRVNLLSN
jgi:hypothetical protein